MEYIYITHLSTFFPNAPVRNEEMEDYIGLVNPKSSIAKRLVLEKNGIRSRYYALDKSGHVTHTNVEMAALAVRRLLAEAAMTPAEIDLLACGTASPEQLMPSHGVMVHGLSDMPPCETVSLAGVCVSGMAAMKYAYQAVKTGEHAAAIAVASENASAIMRGEIFQSETDFRLLHHATPEIGFEKDFLRWMLSDGAGAALLADRPIAGSLNFKIHWIELLSYANEMPPCMYAGAEIRDGAFHGWKTVGADERAQSSIMAVKQDVKLLNEHIIPYTIEKPLVQIIAKRSLKTEDIDWFLPHYSSGFFRDKVAAGLANAGLPIAQEKWFTNLAEKGNTGSASIYIILEEFMRRFPVERGQKVLCYIPESGRFSTCFMLLEAA